MSKVKIALVILIACFIVNVQAQGTKDPLAKAILESMEKEYDSYASMEMQFNLEIALPEEVPDIQEGSLLQKGEQFFLKLDDQEIISDGKDIWVILKSSEEVQINNIDETDGEMMSPKDMIRLYESEDFEYFLINEMREDGKKIKQIEFKPTDRDSEYSKMRLTVYAKDNKMKRLKIFSKDGSRYTLNITKITPEASITKGSFLFNQDNYPGFHIEDLRLD